VFLVGVDVGLVRRLRLRVEGGEVVLRMDAPGGVRCGVALGRGRREAVVEGRARGSPLLMGVLVDFHAGGPAEVHAWPWCDCVVLLWRVGCVS